MLVKLNAWRGEHGPGAIIDLLEAEAAALIHHGAAHPADETDVEPDAATKAARTADPAAAAAAATPAVVSGEAVLTSASGTGDGAQ